MYFFIYIFGFFFSYDEDEDDECMMKMLNSDNSDLIKIWKRENMYK